MFLTVMLMVANLGAVMRPQLAEQYTGQPNPKNPDRIENRLDIVDSLIASNFWALPLNLPDATNTGLNASERAQLVLDGIFPILASPFLASIQSKMFDIYYLQHPEFHASVLPAWEQPAKDPRRFFKPFQVKVQNQQIMLSRELDGDLPVLQKLFRLLAAVDYGLDENLLRENGEGYYRHAYYSMRLLSSMYQDFILEGLADSPVASAVIAEISNRKVRRSVLTEYLQPFINQASEFSQPETDLSLWGLQDNLKQGTAETIRLKFQTRVLASGVDFLRFKAKMTGSKNVFAWGQNTIPKDYPRSIYRFLETTQRACGYYFY